LVIPICKLHAQPGGGGGLVIAGFYNQKLQKINILTDPDIKMRSFVLQDSGIYETFYFQQLRQAKKNISISGYTHDGFVLPPVTYYYGGRYRNLSDQRILIIYKHDTMMIDFRGIIGENAGGYNDKIDSIVIQKGYFKCLRSTDNSNYSGFLRNGITPYVFHTKGNTQHTEFLNYTDKIDTTFLREDNLTPLFYQQRAAHYIETNETTLAFADIDKAIAKNKGKTTCTDLYLLCGAYEQNNQYDKAIESLTTIITNHCSQIYWNKDMAPEYNYRRRIGLYVKNKQYQKALTDYDSIAMLPTIWAKAYFIIERANFKMNYLKDYKSALTDLKTLADTSEGKKQENNFINADIYFSLAPAEYYNGNEKDAYTHWLKAEEMGYSASSSGTYPTTYYDSLIQQHPTIAELYLARSIAIADRGPYIGWGDETQECFTKAIADIDKAESLGLTDYRVNMYRANDLYLLKKYTEAMKEINMAISKNDTIAQCYTTRSQIWGGLGNSKEAQNDWTKANELKKK